MADVPEKILLAGKIDEAGFAQELRVLAAVKLYELGSLSSGRMAGRIRTVGRVPASAVRLVRQVGLRLGCAVIGQETW